MPHTTRVRTGLRARAARSAAVVLLLALGCTSCGYTLAGRGSFLPEYIETIGIPTFENRTPVFEVERLLTQEVRTAFIGRGSYRVQTDEQGVVLRFGERVGTTTPGLNYHLPYPIESVETPKVTRVNRVEVGFRSAEEALMLTGDENIVDINFVVFWIIKDAGDYLFNVREPERSVKAASESVMREIVGQTPIAAALAEGRGQIEDKVKAGVQGILDDYRTGIEITNVQLLKVDPPNQVVDAFRDVQRARADQERLRNEAEAYANDIIPRARGEAERLVQEAEAYKQEVVARSEGDAQRFTQVYTAFSAAKDVTTKRIYLETMEEILSNAEKYVIDQSGGASGVVPYLPLPEVQKRIKANEAGTQSNTGDLQ